MVETQVEDEGEVELATSRLGTVETLRFALRDYCTLGEKREELYSRRCYSRWVTARSIFLNQRPDHNPVLQFIRGVVPLSRFKRSASSLLPRNRLLEQREDFGDFGIICTLFSKERNDTSIEEH